MNYMSMQWVSRLAGLALVAGLTSGLAVSAVAQGVGAQAFGTYVNTPAAHSGQSPLAVLPGVSGTDGAEADAAAASQTISNALSAAFLNSITTGELGSAESGTQSTASAASVSILNGLITADEVVANVASRATGNGAASNADGSTFTNLVVAGRQVVAGDGAVAPNTNVTLPGVGYVVLNEQLPTGDGVTSSGLTVNMIHVYLQSVTGLLGTPSTIGEIIVGSAQSSVGN